MGSLPAELLRGVIVWRLAAPVFIQFILSLRAAVLLPPSEIGLAHGHTPSDAA
jgi:hypothetical protein